MSLAIEYATWFEESQQVVIIHTITLCF